MSILLPKVIPDNVPNVAIAQKYFWNQPSGNAFRARLQQSLQEKSLELLASRRSLVTSHDIIQLDHPLIHQIWHLSISRNQIHPQRRKRYSCRSSFPKTLRQFLSRLSCYTSWDTDLAESRRESKRGRPAHQGLHMVRGVNQGPKAAGPVWAEGLTIPWVVQAVSGSSLTYRPRKPGLSKLFPSKHVPQRLRATALASAALV